MGQCESYQYGLEVETALTDALDNTSTHLTSHVIGDSNLVFHSAVGPPHYDNHQFLQAQTLLIVQPELCYKR